LQGPLYGPLCKVGLKLRPTSSPSGLNSKWALILRCPNKAPLHLEAGPIRCARGLGDLKSSLVIGQKAQIGPNPFTPKGHVDLVV
jgi:hypothetical protein